jgi:hypothetical protein
MDGGIMEFIIFGFMDNFVLILGMYYSFLSIENWLESKFKINVKSDPLVLACVCAGFGNTFSDAMGFLVTLNIEWMVLTIAGCLIGMLIIPIMQKIKKGSA